MASLVAPKTQRNVQALARAGTAVVLKEGQRTESRGGDSLDHGVHIAGSVCGGGHHRGDRAAINILAIIVAALSHASM